MKVLVIRFSSIGDIVLTTPVVRCLKEQLSAEVHYLTKPGFVSLLESNPHIAKIIALPENEGILRNSLKKEKYDVIIDLHHNIRSRRFSVGLAPKIFRFQKLNIQKWLKVNVGIDVLPPVHIVDRYMHTLSTLGVKNDGKGLDFYHTLNVDEVLIQFGLTQDYTVYAIGGQHYTKKLPADRIISILSKTPELKVVLLGGKEDAEIGKLIEKNCSNAVSLCGKTSLAESAAIISAAKKVISHDSGMMHIAAAYGKKILSIWGNTIPEFGMYPFRAHPESKVFEVRGLSCRPCSKIGHSSCPKGHFNCMNQQKVEEIAAELRS